MKYLLRVFYGFLKWVYLLLGVGIEFLSIYIIWIIYIVLGIKFGVGDGSFFFFVC